MFHWVSSPTQITGGELYLDWFEISLILLSLGPPPHPHALILKYKNVIDESEMS